MTRKYTVIKNKVTPVTSGTPYLLIAAIIAAIFVYYVRAGAL